MLETAKAAEALKYDAIWANDNVVATATTGDARALSGVIEPLVTLASFIHVVPNINLGLSVLVLPQRNVFVVAKQIGALDLLSNGRFTLGIGVGHYEDQFEFLGADFANRGAVTDEAIQVLQALWREPKASFDGQFHQFSDAVMFPKPTSGGPPLWIGGNAHAAIRRAAKFGDGWIPAWLEVEELRDGVATLRNLTKSRPVPTIAVELGVRVYLDGQDPPTSLPDYIFKPQITGYPDEIIEALKAYEAVGLEYLLCIFYVDKLDDQLEQMRVFAEQVMPHFSDTV
jgi:probable F420-dependent oxidoreductase